MCVSVCMFVCSYLCGVAFVQYVYKFVNICSHARVRVLFLCGCVGVCAMAFITSLHVKRGGASTRL